MFNTHFKINYFKSLRNYVTFISLTVLLIGCEQNKSSSPNLLSDQPVNIPVLREASASLYDSYASMRAKQISNVSYSLSISLDKNSTTFKGKNILSLISLLAILVH